MERVEQPSVVMDVVTDSTELAKAQAQDERFDRNWVWFEAHAAEIYARHRGKCICIAGEKLFVADTPEDVLNLARTHIPGMTAFLRVIFRWKGRTEFMQIRGLWHLCDDGKIRPVMRGEILAADGFWIKTPFLVDTGADRGASS